MNVSMKFFHLLKSAFIKIRHFYNVVDNTIYFFSLNKNEIILLNVWMFLHREKIESNNYGDDINYHFISELVDKKIFNFPNLLRCLIPSRYKNVLCIGSIIETHCNQQSIIWGSGAMYGGEYILKQKPYKVTAVRGPLTRDFLLSQGIDCPEIYGDPALLLSKYYTPKTEKIYKLGLVPHYTDLCNPFIKELLSREKKDVVLINLTRYNNWHDIIDLINQCEFVLSSSLHGLIISDSYNIPNLWISFSNNISGGYFKYLDYFKAVNRKTKCPIVINSPINLSKILEYKSKWKPIEFDPQPLIKACPFHLNFSRNKISF